MDPKLGDKRLEDVATAAPDGIDRSLPPPPPPGSPPPPQPPSIPESLQKPRNRAFIPAAVLVAVMPIAVWLVAEYWLRGWRNWWFVILGAFCLMGTYTASGGRYGTSGIGRVSPDETDWPNIVGWAFLLGAPAVYGALFIIAGIALLKIDPERLDVVRLPNRLKSRPLLVTLSFLPGWLVICVAFVWKASTTPSLNVLSEGIPTLVAFIAIYALIVSPFMLFFTACGAACLFAVGLALFRSADWVLGRKAYW